MSLKQCTKCMFTPEEEIWHHCASSKSAKVFAGAPGSYTHGSDTDAAPSWESATQVQIGFFKADC